MRSLLTPMLLISLGIHGAFLLMPTSEEEKSTATNTEIVQAAEVENQTFPTSEAKSKLELESQESKLSLSKEDTKAALPSPAPVAVANTQTPVASRTQGQEKATRTRTNTRVNPQPQTRKTKSGKTNSSNSLNSRQSQRNSNPRPSASNSASTARESNSQSPSTASSQQKNVPSNSTTANPTPTATPATSATQRRIDNIPTFNQGNTTRSVNPPTPNNTPVISSLATSNSNTSNTSNSAPVTTVPTIVARTQNQDERVKNSLEFLKTFPRYPQAKWGLPDTLQGEEAKEFFYRLQTRDSIEAVARKFTEELLPQSKFTGELNTDEENWQVYQVSNGKDTQYLHLISQEGNTGIFLASEEFSREKFLN